VYKNGNLRCGEEQPPMYGNGNFKRQGSTHRLKNFSANFYEKILPFYTYAYIIKCINSENQGNNSPMPQTTAQMAKDKKGLTNLYSCANIVNVLHEKGRFCPIFERKDSKIQLLRKRKTLI
jgi:hypothetical protein